VKSLVLFFFITTSAFTQVLPPWAEAENWQEDPLLTQVAQQYAKTLLQWGRISHEGPDGLRVGSRLLKAGYTQGKAGEVLGAGPDLLSIWDAWQKSETHRLLLTDSSWSTYGYGLVEYDENFLLVIVFYKES